MQRETLSPGKVLRGRCDCHTGRLHSQFHSTPTLRRRRESYHQFIYQSSDYPSNAQLIPTSIRLRLVTVPDRSQRVQNLRSHVRFRAAHGLPRGTVIDHRPSKVCELHLKRQASRFVRCLSFMEFRSPHPFENENVLRLQIAMHHVVRMTVHESATSKPSHPTYEYTCSAICWTRYLSNPFLYCGSHITWKRVPCAAYSITIPTTLAWTLHTYASLRRGTFRRLARSDCAPDETESSQHNPSPFLPRFHF